MRLLFILMITLFLNADDGYEKALRYLNGEVGGKTVVKIAPRCPYERCDGNTTYKYVVKDKKRGYELLKSIYKDDERASFEALNILIKQIDYKSNKYDDYLLKKLEKDYGLSEKNYNTDVLLFANTLSDSTNKEHSCKGNFILFSAYKYGYFGLSKNNALSNIKKEIALKNCSSNSYDYFILKNTKG